MNFSSSGVMFTQAWSRNGLPASRIFSISTLGDSVLTSLKFRVIVAVYIVCPLVKLESYFKALSANGTAEHSGSVLSISLAHAISADFDVAPIDLRYVARIWSLLARRSSS
jgi:hypothetical protein